MLQTLTRSQCDTGDATRGSRREALPPRHSVLVEKIIKKDRSGAWVSSECKKDMRVWTEVLCHAAQNCLNSNKYIWMRVYKSPSKTQTLKSYRPWMCAQHDKAKRHGNENTSFFLLTVDDPPHLFTQANKPETKLNP